MTRDEKERNFLLAVAEIFPELNNLGAGDICEDFHHLLLRGIAGEFIETDVNKLLLAYKDADEKFSELRKKYNATTQTAIRNAAVAYKDDIESEILPTAQIISLHKIDSPSNDLISLLKALLSDEKRNQRDELLENLREKFQQLLDEQNIPKEIADDLTLKFMIATNEALEKHSQRILLPEEPPEMWKSGQGETALQFLQRVYQPWLEAKVLTYGWLGVHDPSLRNVLRSAVSRSKDKHNLLLPLTESEVVDREDQELVGLLGEEMVEKIYRRQNTKYKRDSRERKKDTLDNC